jgi:hypothetical protein
MDAGASASNYPADAGLLRQVYRAPIYSPVSHPLISVASPPPISSTPVTTSGSDMGVCRLCRYRLTGALIEVGRDDRDNLIHELDSENRWLTLQVKLLKQQVTELEQRRLQPVPPPVMPTGTSPVPLDPSGQISCGPDMRLQVRDGRVVVCSSAQAAAPRPIVQVLVDHTKQGQSAIPL